MQQTYSSGTEKLKWVAKKSHFLIKHLSELRQVNMTNNIRFTTNKSYDGITDEGLRHLSEALGPLTSLLSISLDFSRYVQSKTYD